MTSVDATIVSRFANASGFDEAKAEQFLLLHSGEYYEAAQALVLLFHDPITASSPLLTNVTASHIEGFIGQLQEVKEKVEKVKLRTHRRLGLCWIALRDNDWDVEKAVATFKLEVDHELFCHPQLGGVVMDMLTLAELGTVHLVNSAFSKTLKRYAGDVASETLCPLFDYSPAEVASERQSKTKFRVASIRSARLFEFLRCASDDGVQDEMFARFQEVTSMAGEPRCTRSIFMLPEIWGAAAPKAPKMRREIQANEEAERQRRENAPPSAFPAFQEPVKTSAPLPNSTGSSSITTPHLPQASSPGFGMPAATPVNTSTFGRPPAPSPFGVPDPVPTPAPRGFGAPLPVPFAPPAQPSPFAPAHPIAKSSALDPFGAAPVVPKPAVKQEEKKSPLSGGSGGGTPAAVFGLPVMHGQADFALEWFGIQFIVENDDSDCIKFPKKEDLSDRQATIYLKSGYVVGDIGDKIAEASEEVHNEFLFGSKKGSAPRPRATYHHSIAYKSAFALGPHLMPGNLNMLEKLELKGHVTSISDGCLNLPYCKEVLLRDIGPLQVIGNHVLKCWAATTIELPSDLSQLRRIGSGLMENSGNIDHVEFPDLPDLESLGGALLLGTKVKHIKLRVGSKLRDLSSSFSKSPDLTWEVEFIDGVVPSTFNSVHCIKGCPVEGRLPDSVLSLLKVSPTLSDGCLAFCSRITSIDLSSKMPATSIEDEVMTGLQSLTALDLGGLTQVRSIGNSFLRSSSSLKVLRLRGLEGVENIGSDFLAGCQRLEEIPDCTKVFAMNLKQVGSNFLSGCKGLSEFPFDGLKNVEALGSRFLMGCEGITAVNLSPLRKLKVLPADFLSGTSLEAIDLTPLVKVDQIHLGALQGLLALSPGGAFTFELGPLASCRKHLFAAPLPSRGPQHVMVRQEDGGWDVPHAPAPAAVKAHHPFAAAAYFGGAPLRPPPGHPGFPPSNDAGASGF